MSNLLAWRLWHWSLGKAGEYKIFYEQRDAALYLPNGKKEVFRTTGEAKDCAEAFELDFVETRPTLPKFWMPIHPFELAKQEESK